MNTATIESAWRASEIDASMQTRGLLSDDWLMPEPVPDSERTTSLEQRESTSGFKQVATDSMPEPCISKPIRKNSLVIRPPEKQVKLLQQWECVILRVAGACVECEMHDLTNESRSAEIAEVFVDEFNHFDRALLEEGAVFYWSIGQEISKTGQVRRYSDLRVRRMPPLSPLRKREISKEAADLSEILGVQ